jgi:ADP-heptose:LPS heptosyltransferase
MTTKGIILFLKAIVRLQRRRTLIPEQVTSLLLIETTRLGDVIAILPVLPRFLRQFPNARLTVAASGKFAPLLSAFAVDIDVLPLHDSHGLWKTLRNIGLVRSRRYDLTCSMSPSRRNALLALGTRSQFRIGYLESRNSVTPFLESTRVTGIGCVIEEQNPFEGRSIYERPHLVANAVQAPEVRDAAVVALRPGAMGDALHRLRAVGLPPAAPYAVVHPFALWEYRSWDARSAANLCRLLVDALSLHVVVVGSSEDFSGQHSTPADLFRQAGAAVFISSDLRDTAALLSQATVFIGTDSGPLHLASALGTPTVGLYGPASPRLTAPPQERGIHLYHNLPCSPCAQRTCVSPADTCMSRHVPAEVLTAVSRLIHRQARVVANA